MQKKNALVLWQTDPRAVLRFMLWIPALLECGRDLLQIWSSRNYKNLPLSTASIFKQRPIIGSKWDTQNNLTQEKQSRKIHSSQFQNYNKATVVKTVWYWHNYSHIDQWDETDISGRHSQSMVHWFSRMSRPSLRERIVFTASSAGHEEK